MSASLNEIYKAIGSLETAVKGLAEKIEESDRRTELNSQRADEHRASVHRRVDELVAKVGDLEADLEGIKPEVKSSTEMADEVRAWKQRGIGALGVVGIGASGLTFLIQHYFEQIAALFRQ